MQIDGAREFFSRISALTTPQGPAAGAQNNSLSAIFPALQGIKSDALNLSDIGKNLSLSVEKAPLLDGDRKVGITDPLLKQRHKYLSQKKDILERMHELATVAAQNKNLTDLERVNMQIEFEELRKDLNYLALGRRESTEPIPSFFGDNSSMVERMRNRIMNGQEWNVREVWSSGSIAPGWHVVDDKDANILTTRNNNGIIERVDTGKKIPTVREALERKTPINFMDAESAAAGVKRLEQDINSVQRSIDRIEKAASEQPNRTWTLSEIGALIHRVSGDFFGGIGPTFTEHFFHSDGKIYDQRHPLLTDTVILSPGIYPDNILPENKQISWPTSPHVVERLTEAKIALAKIEPKIAFAS
jgi:hypothetical protein